MTPKALIEGIGRIITGYWRKSLRRPQISPMFISDCQRIHTFSQKPNVVAMMTKSVTAVALPLLIAVLMTSQAFANPTSPGKDKKTQLASDQEQICRTLTYYYEGSNMGATNAVEGALHPDAQITMLNTANGQVEAINVNQLLKSVSNGKILHTSNLKLLNLDIEGDAAMAKIRVVNTNTGKRSVRYLHLVRAGNQWRIVNETAYSKG